VKLITPAVEFLWYNVLYHSITCFFIHLYSCNAGCFVSSHQHVSCTHLAVA